MAAATLTVVVVFPTPPDERDPPPGVLSHLQGERCRVVHPREAVDEADPMVVVIAVGGGHGCGVPAAAGARIGGHVRPVRHAHTAVPALSIDLHRSSVPCRGDPRRVRRVSRRVVGLFLLRAFALEVGDVEHALLRTRERRGRGCFP
jgi:hypothetical protein